MGTSVGKCQTFSAQARLANYFRITLIGFLTLIPLCDRGSGWCHGSVATKHDCRDYSVGVGKKQETGGRGKCPWCTRRSIPPRSASPGETVCWRVSVRGISRSNGGKTASCVFVGTAYLRELTPRMPVGMGKTKWRQTFAFLLFFKQDCETRDSDQMPPKTLQTFMNFDFYFFLLKFVITF